MEELPLPDEPTACLPGTSGKIEVLEARAAQELPLFHNLDGWALRKLLGVDLDRAGELAIPIDKGLQAGHHRPHRRRGCHRKAGWTWKRRKPTK